MGENRLPYIPKKSTITKRLPDTIGKTYESRPPAHKLRADMAPQGERKEPQNILESIGREGLESIVWSALPWYAKAAYCYGLEKYALILKNSKTLEQFRSLHASIYENSAAYRIFRPRYHIASRILAEKYKIT